MNKSSVILIFFIAFSFNALAKTWIVADHNTSLQQTIRLAKNGDTIIVHKDIFFEKGLVIDKSIVLIGKDKPVLDGEHKYEIIAVKADNVTIDGFYLRNSGASSLNDIAGIKIYNRRNITIRNNYLESTFFGIYVQFGANCIISGNTLHSDSKAEFESGNGIHCWKSSGLQILNNTITGHRDGIYFEFVTNSIIKSNNSNNNVRYGLHFMFSHNDAYIGNTFRHNGSGVAVMYTHNMIMVYNNFAENWGDAAFGILMKDISDSRVERNTFYKNTSGIYMEGSSRIVMKENSFHANGWGLKIQASCNDNTITRNNFQGNTFDVSTNGSLVLNSFDNNYWDKYDGYDLNRDGIGDVPFRPVSMYAMVVEKNPTTMMLFRGFTVGLMEKAEKIFPGMTPVDLKDNKPSMKPINW